MRAVAYTYLDSCALSIVWCGCMKRSDPDSVVIIGTTTEALFQCLIVSLLWIRLANIHRELWKITQSPVQQPRSLSYFVLRQGKKITYVVIRFLNWGEYALCTGLIHFV